VKHLCTLSHATGLRDGHERVQIMQLNSTFNPLRSRHGNPYEFDITSSDNGISFA
jgi:hypothetical protein